MMNLLAPFISTTWLYGSAALLGLGAVIYYAPSIKIKLIAAGLALVIASGLYGYTKGYRDGSSDKQTEWTAAEAAARERAKDARDRGISDDARGLRDPNDCYDRPDAC
jgi:hypothetical protein